MDELIQVSRTNFEAQARALENASKSSYEWEARARLLLEGVHRARKWAALWKRCCKALYRVGMKDTTMLRHQSDLLVEMGKQLVEVRNERDTLERAKQSWFKTARERTVERDALQQRVEELERADYRLMWQELTKELRWGLAWNEFMVKDGEHRESAVNALKQAMRAMVELEKKYTKDQVSPHPFDAPPAKRIKYENYT